MQSSSSDEYSIIQTVRELLRQDETMTRREGVATYKSLERNSSRIVVTKMIKKSKWNAAFQSSLQRPQKLDSPYLVRYVKCHEEEKEYRV